MRIAIISPFQLRLRRGIECSAGSLAVAFARQAQDVEILCWAGSLVPDQRLQASGVRYSIMPVKRYFQAYWAVLFYALHIIRTKPDVVIIFFADYGEALALALTRRLYRPVVIFSVGYPLELVPHRFKAFKAWQLGEHLDGIVVKAPHMARAIGEFFGRPAIYIPNGVDTDYFRPADNLSRMSENFQLITVAAIERRKGFEVVLSALPGVLEQQQNIQYTIVGDGPDCEWLRKTVADLRLDAHVRLPGAVNDVRPFMREADLFLLPSYGEGMPNAYLEALAMGLPTIVSNDPPYDTIAGPAFSIRVNRSDPNMMENAILSLLRDPHRRKQMGQAARREAETKYNWNSVATEYLKLISTLFETDLSLAE